MPLLVDLSINFQERAETSRIVFSNELVQEPMNEELKCHSFGHFAQKDQVFTLTNNWDIVLFDQRCFW